MPEASVTNILAKILDKKTEVSFFEIERLDTDKRYELTSNLLQACENGDVQDELQIETVTALISNTIPYIDSQKRFEKVMGLVDFLATTHCKYGRKVYDALEFPLLRSLQPLEVLSLANHISDLAKAQVGEMQSAPVWGLIRVIPYLHPINQKEYAQDIFEMARDASFRAYAIEALSALIFSLEQKSRMDMVFFFAEVLKGEQDLTQKCLVIELLKKVTASLQEHDRLLLADCLAPWIYDDNYELVSHVLSYYAKCISLLPNSYRVHYTQMISGLVNDFSIRKDVLNVIERALPFISNDKEKTQFYELLLQYGSKNHAENEDRLELLKTLDG